MKNMKKIFLIIISITSVCATQAQYLYGTLGFVNAKQSSPSFESFFNSYNAVNTSTLSTPFPSSWPSAKGWENIYGLAMRKSDGFGAAFDLYTGYTAVTAKTMATFANGETRNLKLHHSDWPTGVGVGAGNNKFFAEVTGGATIRFSTLYSSYTFLDGTESYGTDHKLNGIYSSLRAMGTYGFMAGFNPTRNLAIVFRGTKILNPTAKPGSPYLEGYSDINEWKNDNSENFPQDMVDYLNNPDNLFNNAYIDMHGWQLSLTACFALPLF